ncbi:hypothetical protein AVEN_26230-1 [Araneus ventricosus]|uniref:PiggyBac transposable element-derived protein domain-containing protein n=1 Tax=Araneus ventricosus TaxID=182803 RepID=A0A4Y2ALU1_ARAVE|nr:hypothetical protein AVEN_26230-1 [Araneus ventricosus]
MPLADESHDSDPEMIILPPDPDIVTDDEEIDDACTSIEHGHAIFDEKLQEETSGDKRFFATGTVRENIMAKCPLKSSKISGKMVCGTSDRKFDAMKLALFTGTTVEL